MILRMAVGLATAFLTGYGLVAAFWPIRKQPWPDRVLRLALASGIGLGVSSAGLFLYLCAFGGGGRLYFLADGLILLAALLAWWFKSRRSQRANLSRSSQPAVPATVAAKVLGSLLIAAVAVAAVGFVRLSARKPHGEFDAWTIWNLHARFLFRGQDNWTNMFSSLLAIYRSTMVAGPVSKPDYPLLLPASIARLWNYAGGEALFAPAVIAGVFTFATVAILVSLVARGRGTAQGFLAGLILLGTPAFVTQGAYGFGDVPLGFFLLATLGLLFLYDRDQEYGYLVLAGATAGLGVWTKNEGLVLLTVILFVRLAVNLKFGGLRTMLHRSVGFFAGMAPFLATVIYFKMRFAPGNDMLAGQGMHASAARFTSLFRYVTAGKAFAARTWVFGDWPIPVLLVLAFYALLAGVNLKGRDARFPRIQPLLTVLIAVAAYFFIYVGTPHQLEWHLRYSLDRVLMQLWPSALFAIFLLLNTPDEAAFAG